MKKAIILHGKPSRDEYYDPAMPSQSNANWLAWLQKQLTINNVLAQTPEMPKPYRPIYEDWKETFEQFAVDSSTALIGHSCGGGFLVRYLSENPHVKAGTVVLVAPWINPENQLDAVDFFDFSLQSDIVKQTERLLIIASDNDFASITKSVDILRDKITGIDYREISGKKHFCYEDLGGEIFPELLEELLK